MLIANQAVSHKIKSVEQSLDTSVLIRPLNFDSGSAVNGTLTDNQLTKIKSTAHITNLAENLTGRLTTEGSGVIPRIGGPAETTYYTNLQSPSDLSNLPRNSDGTITLGGKHLPANFSEPIRVQGTTSPTAPIEAINTRITMKSGTNIDGTKDTNEVLISTAMATKNHLQVGSTFSAYGVTLKVAGIFNSNTASGDNYIILPLPTLQRLSNSDHMVTEAVAMVDSVANVSNATDAIKQVVGNTTADVTSSEETINNAIKPLQSIQKVSLYSLLGAITAGATIILLTMIMIVRERKREIGVLKAIGSSNARIILQFMSEALTLTILSAVIGLGLGMAAGNPITKMLVDNSANTAQPTDKSGPRIQISNNLQDIHTVQTQIGFGTILDGFGAALVIALAGSAIAAFSIAKIKPAEVLRSE
jgi:putative ABC transport system permease protein